MTAINQEGSDSRFMGPRMLTCAVFRNTERVLWSCDEAASKEGVNTYLITARNMHVYSACSYLCICVRDVLWVSGLYIGIYRGNNTYIAI